MELTNELIQATVNNITGYIVANVAKQTGRSAEDIMSAFIRSKTYSALSDKETGLYWQSISATMDKFVEELKP